MKKASTYVAFTVFARLSMSGALSAQAIPTLAALRTGEYAGHGLMADEWMRVVDQAWPKP